MRVPNIFQATSQKLISPLNKDEYSGTSGNHGAYVVFTRTKDLPNSPFIFSIQSDFFPGISYTWEEALYIYCEKFRII